MWLRLILITTCVTHAMAATVTCEQLQIDLPEKLERIDVPKPMIFAARLPEGAVVQVGNTHMSPPVTALSDSRFLELKHGFTKKASRIVSEEPTTVGTRPAIEVDLEIAKPNGTSSFSTWFVLNEDAVYMVVLSGFENHAAAKELIQSIHFAPVTSQTPKPPDSTPLAETIGELMFYAVVAIVVVALILRSRRKKTA